MLCFAGNYTLMILVWHVLAFKIASLIIVRMYGLPIEQLAEPPIITRYSCRGWWVAYVIVGISLPLLYLYVRNYISLI